MTQKIPEQLEVVEQLPRNATFKILKYKLRDEYNQQATQGAVMTDRLRGKVAIVTGASRGIGEAIARGLAAEGARVACVARTRNEGDKRVAGSLQATVAAIEAGRWRGGAARCRSARPRRVRTCGRRGARRAGSDRHPRQQRGVDVVRPDRRVPGRPVAALVRDQRARADGALAGRPRRHDPAAIGRDHQHLVGLGARPGSRPLRNTADPARRGALRHREGRARAVQPGARRRALSARRRRSWHSRRRRWS